MAVTSYALSEPRAGAPRRGAVTRMLEDERWLALKPNLTRAEADLRIAMLTAKLKLLDGPPHTLRVKVGTGATHGD